MFGSYIKVKVNKEIWKKVYDVYGKDDDGHDIGEQILKTYMKSRELDRENEDLKRMLEENSITIKALRKSQDKIRNKYNKLEKKLVSTRSNYKNLKQDYENLSRNPKIEERIVYKEDKTALEAIRKRRDHLQEEVWGLRNRLDGIKREKKQMKERMEELEKMVSNWKHRNFAVLVTSGPLQSQDEPIKTNVEILDIDSYFKWKGRPERFKKKRGIKGPYAIKEIMY